MDDRCAPVVGYPWHWNSVRPRPARYIDSSPVDFLGSQIPPLRHRGHLRKLSLMVLQLDANTTVAEAEEYMKKEHKAQTRLFKKTKSNPNPPLAWNHVGLHSVVNASMLRPSRGCSRCDTWISSWRSPPLHPMVDSTVRGSRHRGHSSVAKIYEGVEDNFKTRTAGGSYTYNRPKWETSNASRANHWSVWIEEEDFGSQCSAWGVIHPHEKAVRTTISPCYGKEDSGVGQRHESQVITWFPLFSTINHDINLSPNPSSSSVSRRGRTGTPTRRVGSPMSRRPSTKDSFHQMPDEFPHGITDRSPNPNRNGSIRLINDQTRRLLGKPAKSRNRSISTSVGASSIEEDDIISDDSLNELSWDSEYGLKTDVVQLMWNPETGRYG